MIANNELCQLFIYDFNKSSYMLELTMRYKNFFPVFLLLILFAGCKKADNPTKNEPCFNAADAIRSINNEPAIVWQYGHSSFVITELSTIDSWLIPCNLPDEFKVAGLEILVTGKTKYHVSATPVPGVPEDLIIDNIVRR